MATYRILIVDDQHEVRRMLSSGVRTLGSDFDVVDVPSGEEALLDASRRPVDLLVTDVRLPGFTGFELVNRIQKRNPGLKFILITGMNDPKVRRQVAESGAAAYFYKPIEMADFLDAVERSLGAVSTIFPAAPIIEEEPAPPVASDPSVGERLSALRLELDAIAVALLDDIGQIYAQAGDLPEAASHSEWLPAIMNLLGASARLGHLLNNKRPEGILRLQGVVYSLCLAHLNLSHALLVVTSEPVPAVKLPVLERFVALLTQDLEHELATLREAHFLEGMDSVPYTLMTEKALIDAAELAPEELPAIDAIFQQADPAKKLDTGELDAFWDQLAGQTDDKIINADTLTYEEALKLGLAPGDKK